MVAAGNTGWRIERVRETPGFHAKQASPIPDKLDKNLHEKIFCLRVPFRVKNVRKFFLRF